MKVALYKGKTRLFNKLTSWWLRGEYSHCEVVLGEDDLGMSICASSSFLDSGVRVKHINLNTPNWDVFEIDGDVEYAKQWMREHEGESYDVLGLLGFVLRIIGHKQNRWLCSEAFAAMLGYPDSWRFDPCILGALVKRNYN